MPTTQPLKNGSPSRPSVDAFIAEYLRDPNGRQAAIKAGYSAATADSQASRLLKRAKVRAEIEKAHAEVIARVQDETGINLVRTLREIARIAYFDPRKLFDKSGRPMAITDLDDDTVAAIAGLEVLEKYEGNGKDQVFVGVLKRWKLVDKLGGLDMLMKHLGGYKVNNDQKKPEFAEQMATFIGELHQSGGCRLRIAAKK
jgi:phage terminase small subunit